MINIDFIKKHNQIKELTVSGHSFFNCYGSDIVCAGVSAVTITILNGLTEVCHFKDLDIIVHDGFIKLKIPNNFADSQLNILNLFLNTLLLGYEQIQKEFPQEIKISIREINND